MAAAATTTTTTTTSAAMDLDSVSPTSKTAAALGLPLDAVDHAAALDPARAAGADPDAQATVTDFLDFTEYLPADMMRSLTLIGKLDQTYIDASTRVHNLTSTWGQLPALPPEERPAPVRLRADISQSLNHAVSSRVYSHAEALRMAETVNRHYNRAKTILAKLTTMKENYPPPEELKSPVAAKSPQLSRARVNLRTEGGGQKPRRPRVPRITVPGEVLAPYELNYEEYSDDSDDSSEDDDVSLPRATPGVQPRIKLVKASKPPKIRAPKSLKNSSGSGAPHGGFPPSVPLSQLKPPPDNAVLGSADAPWLQLTSYEMAKLRKRMKKNAQWTPSETMIARELSVLGRGAEAYTLAKKQAEEEGRSFDSSLPAPVYDADGVAHAPFGALSLDTAVTAEERQKNNRGMKLNEAKKLKRENNLSKLAAQEAEESSRQFMETARAFMSGLNPVDPNQASASKAASQSQPKKRKRDVLADADGDKADSQEIPSQKSQPKRTKTETPVPIPPAHETPVHPPQLVASTSAALLRRTTPVPIPLPGHDHSIASAPKSGSSASPPLNGIGGSTTVTTTVPLKMASETPVPPPLTSPQKSTTPILPPVRETRAREAARKEQQKDTLEPSQPAKPVSRPATPGASSAAGDIASLKRPVSRRGVSLEPQQGSVAADRPRRASTARNTPAPESAAQQAPQQQQAQQQRQAGGKRPKRPAPGVVSRTSSGGSTAVGRRKAAPKRKRGQQQSQQKRDSKDSAAIREEAGEVEVDDEGNVIDADEPRYCQCNRVSFGTMIQCDNIDVGIPPQPNPVAARPLTRAAAELQAGVVPSRVRRPDGDPGAHDEVVLPGLPGPAEDWREGGGFGEGREDVTCRKEEETHLLNRERRRRAAALPRDVRSELRLLPASSVQTRSVAGRGARGVPARGPPRNGGPDIPSRSVTQDSWGVVHRARTGLTKGYWHQHQRLSLSRCDSILFVGPGAVYPQDPSLLPNVNPLAGKPRPTWNLTTRPYIPTATSRPASRTSSPTSTKCLTTRPRTTTGFDSSPRTPR